MPTNVDPQLPKQGISKLRSAADALKSSKIDSSLIPKGFPEGPIQGGRDDLKHRLNKHTTSVKTGDGAFSLTFSSEARVAKNRGDRQRLVCGAHKKKGCHFYVVFELTNEGWVLVTYRPHVDETGRPLPNHHNHELLHSEVEVLASSMGLNIPEQLMELAIGMALTSSISAIDKALVANAHKLGLPITWNYDFLRNHLRPSYQRDSICSFNLMEALEDRARSGLKYFVRTDDADVVNRVFVEVDGGLKTWARGGKDNVLLFDTTWGTNRQGFKLGCFITIASTGQTEVVALALLASETKDMFEWAFRCFAKVFKVAPRSIFTDGDQQIANAIHELSSVYLAEIDQLTEAPWAGVEHRLCVYHLSQNFFTHVKPIFGNDATAWRKSIDLFWKTAKETDEASKTSFDAEFSDILALLESAPTSAGKPRAIAWLQELGKRRDQWCLRFIWSTCTWGIHSTQRSESYHASIKSVLCARPDVVQLLAGIDAHNEVTRDRRMVQMQVLKMKQNAVSGSCALVEFLEEHLVPFAMKLVLQQQSQALSYMSIEIGAQTDEHHWWVTRRRSSHRSASNVSLLPDGQINFAANEATDEDYSLEEDNRGRSTTLYGCSCQYTVAFGGLPCRHMIHLHSVQQTSGEVFTSFLINVKDKWLLSAESDVAAQLASLYTMPDPTMVQPRLRPAQQMKKQDRIHALNQMFDAVCNLACQSDEVFDQAAHSLNELTQALLQPMRSQRCSAEQPNRGQNQTNEAPVCEEPSQSTTQTSKTDELSLKALLGVTWTPRVQPTEEQCAQPDWLKSILGCHVALKFNQKRQGGWYSGRVVAVQVTQDEVLMVSTERKDSPHDSSDESSSPPQTPEGVCEDETLDEMVEGNKPMEEGQVKILFPEDNSYVVMTLLSSSYSTTAFAPKNAWMLLDKADLGVDASARAIHPPAQIFRGRPRTTRLRAAAGPLGPVHKKKRTRKTA